MKALPCPGCGAPLAVKQGIASVKCSFCDLDVRPDFNTAPEFEGLTDRQVSKYERRAEDSVKRELYTKALTQYSALAELTEGNLDENYIKFQSLAYSLKLKEFIHSYYNTSNGSTLIDMQNESKYAASSEPSFTYTRLDVPMLEIIEEVEDKCETLSPELAKKLAYQTYEDINADMISIGFPAVIHIYTNFSYYEEEIYGEFGDYTETYALPEAVYIAMKLQCEIFNMLFKYLETVDIGNSDEANLRKGGLVNLAITLGMQDIDLCDYALTVKHPSPYKITELVGDEVVDEFLNYVEKYKKEWKSFYDDYLQLIVDQRKEEEERIRKEKEEEERIRLEKLEKEKKEREEKERIRIEKIEKEKKDREEKERIRKLEAEKKKQEWLASPEYAASKKRKKTMFTVLFLIVAIAGGGFFIKNTLIQDKDNEVPVSIKL
tara:strand:- start:282 stop:1583 length:1302 start_codon:yes stop_codon:yes gene_type:complete